jgi:uracil phosphoribosyltransferase
LVDHHLGILREKTTPPSLFRQQVQRLSIFLGVEALRDLTLSPKTIHTPIEPMQGLVFDSRIAIVPILRAGLGMVDPLLLLMPDAEVWHLGMYRDEATSMPVEYYCKLPDQGAADTALVLDPMLATGGSIHAACSALHRWGVRDIRVLSVIATQVGIDKLHSQFPNVHLFVAKIDQGLNEHNFIVPGLGDAGDRIFNTRSNSDQ